MKVSRILMMGVATLGLATFANAGTETFTITSTPTTGTSFLTSAGGSGYTNGGLLPYFNASGECPGCVLTSVTFTLGGSVQQTFDIQNTTSTAGQFNEVLKDSFSLAPQVAGVSALNAGLVLLTTAYSTANLTNIVGGMPFPDNGATLATLGAGCAFVVGNAGNNAGTDTAGCGTLVNFGNTAYTVMTGVTGTYTASGVLAALTYSTGPTGYASAVSTTGLDSSTFSSGVVDHTAAYSAGAVTVAYTYSTPSTGTPEPVSMILFGTGLSALALIGRKRFSRS